LLALNI